MSRLLVASAVLLGWIPVAAQGAEAVSLLTAGEPTLGWTFGNGPEFPGATGRLTVDPGAGRGGKAGFKLEGDFSRGGNYVQAGRMIGDVDIRELSLWIRNPDADRFTVRLVDASEQTHQIDIRTEPRADWQQVVFPLERFFASRGRADAITMVAKYESWGGAQDGRWHGPAKAIYLLAGNPGPRKARTLWIGDIALVPRPAEVPGAEVATAIRLDEVVEGEHDWRFSPGQEFPGARGSLAVVPDEPAPGRTALKLAGDFTGGGAYVAAIRDLGDLGVKDVASFRLRLKTDNASTLGVQLVDGTGQAHQQARLPIAADGRWHDLVLEPARVAGGEHWGGANDGRWHAPPTQLSLTLSDRSDATAKRPSVLLADIRAEALLPVFSQPPAFRGDFEGSARLPDRWTAEGNVSIDAHSAANGASSLLLSRSLEDVGRPCAVASPPFEVTPGRWEIGVACRSDLHSPDNSYRGLVALECSDRGGRVVDEITLAERFSRHDWQATRKRVDLPRGVASARFLARLDKTYGRFWLDDLSAAYLAPAPRGDDRIARLLFSTSRLGNLLFPDDPRRVGVTVEALRPLRDDQKTLSYEVRDYWGAEPARPATATLTRAGKKDGRSLYETSLDLGSVPLEVGRYYELHAAIPRDGGEPFRNFTSFAILPEAVTRRHKPEEIPFTARCWDNRIPEFFHLADRLGLRTCGIWGGWSSRPPFTPEAPGIELCRKLGMGVLTGTPSATIERGEKEYGEEALRTGVRHFIQTYGHTRPLYIDLGNEPHGTGGRVRANVEAYRVVYEEVKKVDPSIVVIATAVEPNEEYFRAGYGKWCDAYDFHVYEGAEDVRKAIEAYRGLMKTYGHPRPIWSTELGLNSQGLPRLAVAVELIKKFTTFFAAGGANASWFGLLYPDPDAKLAGSSGDAHNVFDCRYSRYCPRLDAIAYYNAVNAIAIKKFAGERHYPDGIRAFLFRDRDGRALQVLWKDEGRRDVFLPLGGVERVELVRVDGRRSALDAHREGITLSITEDPVMLLYQGGGDAPAEALGPPAAALPSPPRTVSRRGSTELTVVLAGPPAGGLDLIAPPRWTVQQGRTTPGEAGRSTVRFLVTGSGSGSIREAEFFVTLGEGRGELSCRPVVAE